jgi:hypothetical protein
VNHSALRAPPLSGALRIYTRACYFSCYQALCCVVRFSFLPLRPQLCFEFLLFVVIIAEMAKEKKSVDPVLASFYEAMERTNVEKITDEMLAGLSRDSSDN